MIPNFASIGMTETQQMFYQLRSFKFKNTFNNILATDKIYYRINLVWTYPQVDNPQEIPVLRITNSRMTITTETGAINLGRVSRPRDPALTNDLLKVDGTFADKCMTASDIVDMINQELATQAMIAYLNQQSGVNLDTLSQNLIYFVCACSFTYNSDSGQFGLVFNSDSLIETYTAYIDIDETNVDGFSDQADLYGGHYYLTGVNVELFTPHEETEEIQARMSRYFGMYSTPSTVTPHNINAKTPLFYVNLSTMSNEQQLIEAGMEVQNIADEVYTDLKKIITNGNIFNRYLKSVVFYTGTPMNVYRYQAVYIHTSLNTNYWDQYGKRTDVMDIIPITIGQTELAVEHTHTTRIYQIKDTDMRTFTIRLTDENNEEIEFVDNYLLNIAIFFSDL